MRLPILTSEKFAEWFSKIVPGAYRSVTPQDIRDMAVCSLVGRSGYFGRSDIETVRGILQYEQLRLDREKKANTVRTCNRCGASLPDSTGVGRPREYCSECESYRGRERWRKWYQKEQQCINLHDGGDKDSPVSS